MDNTLYGKIILDREHVYEFLSENKINFEDQDKTSKTNEDMEEWAMLLNSPWSQKDESYTIEVNCKDAYTKMEEGAPVWRCIYEVVGYECTTATCIGYGNTEEEALMECKKLFKYLQETYNKENDSI